MFQRTIVDAGELDERDVALAWDQDAAEWISAIRSGHDVLRESFHNPLFFGDFLPNLAGMDVLDLGCGEGHNTRLLARMGARLTGVDLSAKLIAAAQAIEDKETL